MQHRLRCIVTVIQDDVGEAVRRARVKREIARLLAEESSRDRRTILADLLAAEMDDSGPVRSVSGSASGPRSHSSSGSRSGAKVASKSRAGASRDAPSGSSYPAQTISLLLSKPHTPIPEMARLIFGDSSKIGQHKMRALLHGLKRSGRARAVQRGKWEVIHKPPA
jgi:hypothetical protein